MTGVLRQACFHSPTMISGALFAHFLILKGIIFFFFTVFLQALLVIPSPRWCRIIMTMTFVGPPPPPDMLGRNNAYMSVLAKLSESKERGSVSSEPAERLA